MECNLHENWKAEKKCVKFSRAFWISFYWNYYSYSIVASCLFPSNKKAFHKSSIPQCNSCCYCCCCWWFCVCVGVFLFVIVYVFLNFVLLFHTPKLLYVSGIYSKSPENLNKWLLLDFLNFWNKWLILISLMMIGEKIENVMWWFHMWHIYDLFLYGTL